MGVEERGHAGKRLDNWAVPPVLAVVLSEDVLRERFGQLCDKVER